MKSASISDPGSSTRTIVSNAVENVNPEVAAFSVSMPSTSSLSRIAQRTRKVCFVQNLNCR